MLIVRPVRISDLPLIETMAVESGIGVTSLPNNREKLYEKIQTSLGAFEHEAIAGTGREYYMFVLEDEGRVIGTASISASAGFEEPFYSYRSETMVHASRALKVNNRIHVLTMCHDLTGMVQLCGFFCSPQYQLRAYELLSRARLLYMAAARERFGRRILVEMQGMLDENDQSPFWDAIGRRFFNMDFPQVEQAFAQRSKTFIAELMPTYPIYVPLLPDAAQNAIGQIHPDFERPFSILSREGFEADDYIDIFDGGAVLTAEVDQLFSLRQQGLYQVEVAPVLPAGAQEMLLSNHRSGQFAATQAHASLVDDVMFITQETARALSVSSGQRICTAPLLPEAGRAQA
ncbi:MAG: arginine/ornithine succinyltransferase subunit alpha [Vogesella sp.]|nr:arginine/ornithine succinyltransferase subunit alpha [Vogesella sp.]